MKDLPSAIRDRGSSIRNNSDRTARVYEKRNHSGRHVCVTRSGGSIHDLRGYNLNDQTRSLKINRNDCGCPSPIHRPRPLIRRQQSAPPGKRHREGLISMCGREGRSPMRRKALQGFSRTIFPTGNR
ncbi:peptidase inhibitor family I36 protein [Streptomyces violaceus]|uniref:peptidase inhibitor family I36 protein n=1 Tax=Streptomyces violaceus TaxID=1936 RepID=UPI0037F36FCD